MIKLINFKQRYMSFVSKVPENGAKIYYTDEIKE